MLSRRTASAQDHSSRTSCRHSVTRAHILPARRDTPVQIGLSTGATIQTGKVGWPRYGALNGGNGEDGIAAVLGGVALIDLFGSLRRPNLLPTRPGPQNSSPASALAPRPLPLYSSTASFHSSSPGRHNTTAAPGTILIKVLSSSSPSPVPPARPHLSSVSQQWSFYFLLPRAAIRYSASPDSVANLCQCHSHVIYSSLVAPHTLRNIASSASSPPSCASPVSMFGRLGSKTILNAGPRPRHVSALGYLLSIYGSSRPSS